MRQRAQGLDSGCRFKCFLKRGITIPVEMAETLRRPDVDKLEMYACWHRCIRREDIISARNHSNPRPPPAPPSTAVVPPLDAGVVKVTDPLLKAIYPSPD